MKAIVGGLSIWQFILLIAAAIFIAIAITTGTDLIQGIFSGTQKELCSKFPLIPC